MIERIKKNMMRDIVKRCFYLADIHSSWTFRACALILCKMPLCTCRLDHYSEMYQIPGLLILRTLLGIQNRNIPFQIPVPLWQGTLKRRILHKIFNRRGPFDQRIFSPRSLHQRKPKRHSAISIHTCWNCEHGIPSLCSDLVGLAHVRRNEEGV